MKFPLSLVLVLGSFAAAGHAADACMACPCDLVLDETFSTVVAFESCDTISTGPSLAVVAPGRLTLSAGELVAFGEGLSVGEGAELVVGTDALLAPPVFTAGPLLTMAPNPLVPLAGLVELATSIPTRITLEITGPGAGWMVDFTAQATVHAVPAVGFQPDKIYEVRVIATAANGLAVMSGPLPAQTPPLPADFPSFSVTSDPTKMETGVTIFGATRFSGDGSYLVMVNEVGEVVWYRQAVGVIGDVRRLANGNLLIASGSQKEFSEVDLLGNVVDTWLATALGPATPGTTAVATDTMHHEVFETTSGTLLFLSTEVRALTGYPTSETDPTPRLDPVDVVGDVVVEISRDGSILRELPLMDILDPYRIAYDSFANFWASIYGGVTLDWSHGNAVIQDPSDGSMIVSTRHQDAVFKFNTDKDLIWILGPAENWLPPYSAALLTPVGMPFQFPYHQHAPALTPWGTLLVFDNANYQASPPDPKQTGTFSRAVEYEIDETDMEVTQLWEYGAAGEVGFCPIVGDADPMPATGNVLIVCGWLAPTVEGEPSVRIVEVTREAPATVVFELLLTDDNPAGPANRLTYRAERLPSIYP